MRKRFELSPILGSTPISEVTIPLKSRDELPPVLLALKTIFVSKQYHQDLFEIAEPVILKGKKQTGREGMTIWEVIVLSVIRLTLNTNYDRLLWTANYDKCVRQLMGIEGAPYGFSSGPKQYSLTALKENIGLLKLETIEKINALVLEVGQGYLKKKTRKSGGKNKESRLKTATRNYLDPAQSLNKKIREFKAMFKADTIRQCLLLVELEYYSDMLTKHIDLVERRLLKGEMIPHSEKVFSLFEPHTKWIGKGKAGVIAELGQKHLIVTDQHHFIVHHKVMGDTPDSEVTIKLGNQLKEAYGDRLKSLSFDKGFSSKDNINELGQIIPNSIIKQKGRLNKTRKELEQSEGFRKLNNVHQAIESNIDQLEYHGLNKCRDKGEDNFKKYVSLAVLSYNLHRSGNLIKKKIAKENIKMERKAA